MFIFGVDVDWDMLIFDIVIIELVEIDCIVMVNEGEIGIFDV